MRLALLSYRFPWPAHTGDRVRAILWLDAMSALGDVTLIAPGGELPPRLRHITHIPLVRSAAALMRSALHVARKGLPYHTLTAGSYEWPRALAEAERHGTFDAVVVLLSRCDPWLTMLHARARIMDAIDASSLSMSMRSGTASLTRGFWSSESRKAARLEATFSSKYDSVVVINQDEIRFFGPRAVAVPPGVAIYPAAKGDRDIEFGFWGRLAYFANRNALTSLLDQIWPAIRRALPRARLLVAGADAPRFVRRWHGREGVIVVSPMGDRSTLLRRVAIAVFPMRHGTGVSNKVLEAAEASCAIVATPQALSGLPPLRACSAVEESIEGLIGKCVALGNDPQEARWSGERLRKVVEKHYASIDVQASLRAMLARSVGP